MLAEKGVDWKQAYVAWKFKLAGEAQTAAEYAYLEAFGEAWGRTLYGGMSPLVPRARRRVVRPLPRARRTSIWIWTSAPAT